MTLEEYLEQRVELLTGLKANQCAKEQLIDALSNVDLGQIGRFFVNNFPSMDKNDPKKPLTTQFLPGDMVLLRIKSINDYLNNKGFRANLPDPTKQAILEYYQGYQILYNDVSTLINNMNINTKSGPVNFLSLWTNENQQEQIRHLLINNFVFDMQFECRPGPPINFPVQFPDPTTHKLHKSLADAFTSGESENSYENYIKSIRDDLVLRSGMFTKTESRSLLYTGFDQHIEDEIKIIKHFFNRHKSASSSSWVLEKGQQINTAFVKDFYLKKLKNNYPAFVNLHEAEQNIIVAEVIKNVMEFSATLYDLSTGSDKYSQSLTLKLNVSGDKKDREAQQSMICDQIIEVQKKIIEVLPKVCADSKDSKTQISNAKKGIIEGNNAGKIMANDQNNTSLALAFEQSNTKLTNGSKNAQSSKSLKK